MDSPEPPQVLVVAEDPLARLLTADLLVDAGFRTFEVSPDHALETLEERSGIETVVLVAQGANDIYLSYLASVLRESWPNLELLELKEELIFCSGRQASANDEGRLVTDRLVDTLQPALGGRARRVVQERDPRRRSSVH